MAQPYCRSIERNGRSFELFQPFRKRVPSCSQMCLIPLRIFRQSRRAEAAFESYSMQGFANLHKRCTILIGSRGFFFSPDRGREKDIILLYAAGLEVR